MELEILKPEYVTYVGLLILVVEFALGKTSWIKANSTIEAVLNVTLKILSVLKPKK